MDSDEEFLEDVFFLASVGKLALDALPVGQRRWWVRELNLSRETEGYFIQNFEKMKTKDPEHFFKMTRMRGEIFDFLLQLLESNLEKTSRRKPIEPKFRLFLCLLYLSQGVPFNVLGWMFKLGYETVRLIIYETCEIIWEILMPFYLTVPTEDEWQRIANDFDSIWNLPNCVASIDGKHINIKCPPNAGSEYFNYKGHHSIVLLASCDANYVFTSVDVGAYGSQSDGGIFAESSFGKKLITGNLNLPSPSVLKNSNFLCEYYLVGDSAFPLKTYLMRPYPRKNLDSEKFHFNYRLSRARRVIENAFGILVARWRILLTTLNMLPSNADKIVKACVVLHNFLKLNDGSYCPPEFVDRYDGEEVVHGLWRQHASPLEKSRSISSNFSARNAFEMRESLKSYLFHNQI